MQKSSNYKKISFLFVFILMVLSGQTQVKFVQLSHYLFPEFENGVVLMKSGIKNEAILNYNSLTSEMIFDSNGTKLALSQIELIDSIFIKGRKFILLNQKFVELIYHSNLELFAEHKCSILDPGKPSGYGGTSQTAATTTYSSYYTSGQVYNLKLPEGLETKSFVEYWLKKDGALNKFISLRQLNQLFPEKSDLIKSYKKNHDVKYDDQDSIIELIKYLDLI